MVTIASVTSIDSRLIGTRRLRFPRHYLSTYSQPIKESHTHSAVLAPNLPLKFFPWNDWRGQSFEHELPVLAIDASSAPNSNISNGWSSWTWIGQQKYIPKGYSDFRHSGGSLSPTLFTAAHQLLYAPGTWIPNCWQMSFDSISVSCLPSGGNLLPSYHIWNKLEVSWFLRYVFIGHNQISLSTNSTLLSKDTES